MAEAQHVTAMMSSILIYIIDGETTTFSASNLHDRRL